MVQIFFFMTMLTAAALLLNLFWYLEDSYRTEERIMNRRHTDRHYKKPAGAIRSVSLRSITQTRSFPYYSETTEFFTVGSPDADSFLSNTTNHSECA